MAAANTPVAAGRITNRAKGQRPTDSNLKWPNLTNLSEHSIMSTEQEVRVVKIFVWTQKRRAVQSEFNA